eukprot:PhM_4_TR14270/c2_g4_i6/m.4961
MQGLTPRGVPHDVVFFPQDGRLGTAQVEYASVSVHERNDLTPVRQQPREPRRSARIAEKAKAAEGRRAEVIETDPGDEDEDSTDTEESDASREVDEEDEGEDAYTSTYEFHKPEFYQEPAMWATFLKTRMDLAQAKTWFKETCNDTYNHEAERNLHQRVVLSLCYALEAAFAQPGLVVSKAWQESQRLLITSLVVQTERYHGATDQELKKRAYRFRAYRFRAYRFRAYRSEHGVQE